MSEAVVFVLIVGVHVFAAVMWLRFVKRGGHVRDLVRIVRDIPDSLAGWLDEQQMTRHDPERVGNDVWCVGHGGKHVLWPCHEWTEAAERRQARRHEKTKAPTTRQET